MHVVEFSRYGCSRAREVLPIPGRATKSSGEASDRQILGKTIDIWGKFCYPGLKTLKNKGFSSKSGAERKATGAPASGQIKG